MLELAFGAGLASSQVTAAQGASDAQQALPSPACVRSLRAARIARLREDAAAELAGLRGALPVCAEVNAVALVALLDYDRRLGLPEGEHDLLHAELQRRLSDQSRPLPPGILDHLAREPELDPQTMEALHVALRSRLAREASPRLLEIVAEVEQRLEHWEDAARTLERLRTIEPSERLLWALVRLYDRLERWSDMATLLGEVVKGGNDALRYQYIEALSLAGDAEQAASEIAKLVASVDRAAPIAVDAVAELTLRGAWNLRDAGREAEAESLFRLVLDLDADNAESLAVLLHLYGSEEERAAHQAALSERWSQETDPRALLEQATERLTARDDAGAFELLERAAPELPDLEAAWYNLGIAAYRIERWSEAESAFARAATLNPARAESAYFRGLALVKLERCAEAIAPLERALELDPARSLAHYHLSICYGRVGDLQAAERHGRAYEAAKPR